MGLMALIMASYLGLYGILSGLTKSTDHPSTAQGALRFALCQRNMEPEIGSFIDYCPLERAPSQVPATSGEVRKQSM